MSFRVTFVSAIFVILASNPALAEKPPYSALNNIAIALGSTAADVAACGEKDEADIIKYNFEAAIVGCVYKTSNDGKLEIIFDTARSQRSFDIKEVGGNCKGEIKERIRVIAKQIKRIEDACDGKD